MQSDVCPKETRHTGFRRYDEFFWTGILFFLLSLPLSHAADASVPSNFIPYQNWWRNCASLDLDFYNDRYYINGNTTCDSSIGAQYSGVNNFISGAGATFTRAGTNVTDTSAPSYLASNNLWISRAVTTAEYYAYLSPFYLSGSQTWVSRAATTTTDTDYFIPFYLSGSQAFSSRAVTTATYYDWLAPFYLSGTQAWVSRASSATYFNSSGTLSTAATNVARTNYTYNGSSWVNAGTLIEPTATNVLLYSVPTSSTWTVGSAATLTNNATTDPAGTTTAAQFSWTSAGNSTNTYAYQSSSATIISGASYTYSIYVEAGTWSTLSLFGGSCSSTDGAYAKFSLSGSGSVTATGAGTTGTYVSSGISSLGNGWYRAWVTAQTASTTSACLVLQPTSLSSSSGNYYAWGAQIEAGSSATTYIATSGSAATRSADVYTTPFDGTYFNSSGTLTTATTSVVRATYSPTSPYGSLGSLIEPASTNYIQNSQFSGIPSYPSGVYTANSGNLGNGGHWSITTSPGWLSGSSVTIVDAGTTQGLNYLDINVTATNSSGSTYYYNFNTPSADRVTITSGMRVNFSAWVGVTSYTSTGGTCQLIMSNRWYTSGGTPTNGANTDFSAVTTFAQQNNNFVAPATAASADGWFYVSVPNGTTCNITFRIAAPQLEIGPAVTSYIPTSGSTVTRNADVYTTPFDGTYENSSGVLSTATTSVARTNYTYNGTSWSSAGTLIEPAATNMIANSQSDFAGWPYFSSGASAIDNTTTSPDGTTDASTLTTSAAYTGTYQCAASAITPGVNYVASVYMQAGTLTGSYVNVGMGNNTGSDGASAQFSASTYACLHCYADTSGTCVACGSTNVGNGWHRLWVEGQTASSTQGCVHTGTDYNTTGTVYLYGAQLEQGASPTSYIPALGTTVVRNADVYNTPFDGTFTNSSGVITTDTTSLARTNYTYNGSLWSSAGTLIEPASTNLLYDSIVATPWSTLWPNIANMTIEPGQSSPDGGTNAAYLLRTTINSGGDDVQVSLTSSVAVSNPATASVYAKAGTNAHKIMVRLQGTYPDRADVVCDLNAGTVAYSYSSNFTINSTSIVNAGGGWYRCVMSATPTNTAAASIVLSPTSATSGGCSECGDSAYDDATVFGAQVESGLYATTYIPTSGYAVTRNADVYAIPAGGSYFDNTGTMQYAAPNAPRLDHSTTSPYSSQGILIEESRTNLLEYSQGSFKSSPWTGSNETITDNDSSATAPDGTTTASSFTTASGGYWQQCITGTAGTPYTASVFVKIKSSGSGGTTFGLNVGKTDSTDGAGGQAYVGSNFYNSKADASGTYIGSGVQTLNNGWYRYWISGETASSTSICWNFGGVFTNPETLYLWGAQLEQGAVPTSYIPVTGTSTVTRPADVFTVPTTAGGSSGWYNASAGTGTLITKGVEPYLSGGGGGYRYPSFAGIDDGTTNNSVGLLIQDLTSSFEAYESEMWTGGTEQTGGGSHSGYTAGTAAKMDMAFATNSLNMAYNGTLGTLGASVTVPTGLTVLRVGSSRVGNYLDGWDTRITYLPVRVPDASLTPFTK